LYSLTPREILNRVGIVSIKCLKNGQIDGIIVSVGSSVSERKIQPNLSKELARITKGRCFYVTKKSPGIEGKISLGSNGTPLLVRFVHGIRGCRKDAEKPGLHTGSLQ
jgi:hypothetical protein